MTLTIKKTEFRSFLSTLAEDAVTENVLYIILVNYSEIELSKFRQVILKASIEIQRKIDEVAEILDEKASTAREIFEEETDFLRILDKKARLKKLYTKSIF